MTALRSLRRTLFASLALLTALTSHGQVAIPALDTPVAVSFDSLASTGTSNPWTNNATLPGWYSTRTLYIANSGSSNSGGLYSYGTSAADRALGSVGSGSTGTIHHGLRLVNTTGTTITAVDVVYTGEQWRNGGNTTPHTIDFSWQAGATAINAGTWTDVDALDFTGPVALAAAGALDGNLPANRLDRFGTISGLALAPGQEVWIRWTDIDNPGSDHGLAVDDLTITAHGGAVETDPAVTATVTPNAAAPGAAVSFSATVIAGTNPPSTGITVAANLSAIGGSATQAFAPAGANTFTFDTTVSSSASQGTKALTITVSDAEGRSSTATLSFTVTAPPPENDHIVISQIYGGGGNSGAPFNSDYVELYNPTTTTFNVTGWTIQYASASGSSWQYQPLAGEIPPGTYYLVALASGAQGSNLPPANVDGNINMSASSGKVALVRGGTPLSGTCPLSDPLLADFVGFGSANCSEGSLTAPAGSNTRAIFREDSGLVDTNVNRNDFETLFPNPRRTAPIAEIGPHVVNSDPRPGNTLAPRDASVVVIFSESVDVDTHADWFDISCASSGAHDSATVATAFGNTNWIITPNQNFVAGEQCSVTIRAQFVHDSDHDDATPATDNLPADHTFSFHVATGAAPPYPPSVHLEFGNPSNAAADLLMPNNYLMEKPEFALSYNRDRGTPNWVSWHLADEWQCCLSRVDTFRPDPAVPAEWYRVLHTDYSSSGFDRGHMVPNADRNLSSSIPVNQATFLMTNMIPQSPHSNQGPWEELESYLRTLLPGNELYIVAGGAGTGGSGTNGFATTIANGRVTVPAVSWKVALVLPKGDGDLGRVSGATRTIAAIMPNVQGISDVPWRNYLTSVDAVEQLTGYDFFANVPDAVEHAIEAGVDGANPPGAADQSVATDEDVAKTFTLDSAAGGNTALTYSVVNAPSHGVLSMSGSSVTYTPAPNFFGTDTFTWQVSDGVRQSRVATAHIHVMSVNDVPVASVSAPSLAHEGTAVTATVTASDVETANLAYSWTVSNEGTPFTSGSGTTSFTFTPDAAGMWTISATAADADGAAATSSATIIVVDPEAGFVTGGGFFDGPRGRAIFSVGSKYLGDVPSGNTNLKTGGLDFDSTSQQWLVVTGSKAQFAGEGTINRTSGYAFLVTVEDAATDKIRFRIWEKATGTVVFDNGAAQPIGGGSIQIHP